MTIILTKSNVDLNLILKDESVYDITRGDYAYFLFLTNKRTKSNVPVTTTVVDRYADDEWTQELKDGYYKAEMVLIPDFTKMIVAEAPETISEGTIVYDEGKVYKALVEIPKVEGIIISPNIDYNNWEEVIVTKPSDLYDAAFAGEAYEDAHYGSIQFIHYINIIYKYLDLSKKLTRTTDICKNTQIDELRCLRDKYEAIELASAASDYYGAQTIIESYENLTTTCPC